MRKMLKAGTMLALIGSPAMAHAGTQSACITEAEASALMTFMMPEALNGALKTCKAGLPKTSFLVARGDETMSRYRAAAAGSWPAAKAAFLKIAGDDDDSRTVAAMSDATLQPFVAETLSVVIAKDIPVANCPKVDRLVEALAPVPPTNVAALMTALISLVGGKEKNDFNIC